MRARTIRARRLSPFAGLALGACAAAPPPATTETGVALPPAWSAAATAARSAGANVWWRSFGEPLGTVIEEALAHNHELRAAGARIAAAQAQARLAGAELYPQLDAALQASRQRLNFIGFPIPGTSRPPSRTFDSYGLSLNASWELDLWGRVRDRESAALADVEASLAELDAARLSLAAQTAKVWFAVLEARLQLELARATAASYATTLANVRERYERGVRPSVDLRLARNSLASAQALANARAEQHDRARRQLELLLGRYPAGAVRDAGELPALPGPVPAGLPSELLGRRPDLVAAERALAAAGARAAVARAALLPRISLTASAGTTSDALEDLLDGDFFAWSLAGSLLQPLFAGGRLRADADLALARQQEAAARYAQQALTAFTEVESALAAAAILGARESALDTAAREADAARALAEQRYRDGLGDFIGVLEAQRRALIGASDLLAVRRQRLEVRIDLHLALGGGFANEAAP
jgi:NodT family efflux transporter outer membrane factor (OMF) lipoprotein